MSGSRAVRLAALSLVVLPVTQGWASSFTQGSTTVARTTQDVSAGIVVIYAGGFFPAGENVTTFSWFLPAFPDTTTVSITPLLFSFSNGTYTVEDVGVGHEITGNSPAMTVSGEFGSNEGSTITGAQWTFGFVEAFVDTNGNTVAPEAGGVQFNTPIDGPPGAGGAGTTNDWEFTPSSDNVTTVAIGTTFGNGTFPLNNPALGGFNADRTYSAQASGVPAGVAEPGTFSLITGAGLVLAGLFRYRRRRGRSRS